MSRYGIRHGYGQCRWEIGLSKLEPNTKLLLIGMRVREIQAGAYTVSIRVASNVLAPGRQMAATIVVE
jgi:hypothetical protein